MGQLLNHTERAGEDDRRKKKKPYPVKQEEEEEEEEVSVMSSSFSLHRERLAHTLHETFGFAWKLFE